MTLLLTIQAQEAATADQKAIALLIITIVLVGAAGIILQHTNWSAIYWMVEQYNGFVMSHSEIERDTDEAVRPLPDATDGSDGRTDDAEDETPVARPEAVLALLAALRAGRPVSRDAARALLTPLGMTFPNAMWTQAAPAAPQPADLPLTPITGRPYDPALYDPIEPQAAKPAPQPPQNEPEEPQAPAVVAHRRQEDYHQDDPRLRYVPPQATAI
jgi:hypothetical protein